MELNKEDILKKLKKEFDDLNYRWNIERNKFEAKSQHLSADALRRFEEEKEKLLKLRDEMKFKLDKLDDASENAWDDVKEGAEEAYKALSEAFKKAISHFK